MSDSFLRMNLLSIDTSKFGEVRIHYPYTKTFIEAGKVYHWLTVNLFSFGEPHKIIDPMLSCWVQRKRNEVSQSSKRAFQWDSSLSYIAFRYHWAFFSVEFSCRGVVPKDVLPLFISLTGDYEIKMKFW